MRQFNVVVLGVRYIRDIFIDYYDPTIEEEYRRTVKVDGELSSLEVLDTAGAEQFTSLNEVYIKAGKGFVLVFSLTQEASLKEVDNLRKQIYQIKGGEADIPIVVVGTKLDLVSEREVPKNTIQNLANRWGHPFYETSAKRNWHVTDVFEDLVRQMRKKYPNETSSPKKSKRKHGKDGNCIIM
ncbi:rap 1A [Mucidula mucida]|nr:rap 1A [Mucidula mucida]